MLLPASHQDSFFTPCRTGNISIAASGMQILFYTQPCDSPALACRQFAGGSLLCSVPFGGGRRRGRSWEPSPNRYGCCSSVLKFQNDSEFCSCRSSYRSLNWNLCKSPPARAAATLLVFVFFQSGSQWREFTQSLFKSVWRNLKVTKEEHLKMRCVISVLAQIKTGLLFFFFFFKRKGHNPGYREEKQLKWII